MDEHQWYLYPVLAARVARLAGGPFDVAVDMGTGPGLLTAYLARDLARRVHAVDINPAMHELARSTCTRMGVVDRVEFDRCDVHRLPYPDNHADLVVSYSCFHHWADPVTGLRECFRILRPGGMMVIWDTDGSRKSAVERIARVVRDPAHLRFVTEAFDESYAPAEVSGMVAEAHLPDPFLGPFSIDEEDVMAAIDDLANGASLPDPGEAGDGTAVAWELIVRKADPAPAQS
ncbi:class I SAM-dependent methyltransferase [Micromonospora sp. NPDC000316]|uniref:class I SAM-dependent methyltransferase n=1 Tax=Micromonospora sp. NPDC000316 TaxID=3364216 RepID=UPI0036865B89